jgi:hypothetical protein
MTVGVLVAAIALALLTAVWRHSIAAEIVVLGVATSLGLAAIDVTYVARGVIRPIYLVDAVLQLIIALTWLTGVAWNRERSVGSNILGAESWSAQRTNWTKNDSKS